MSLPGPPLRFGIRTIVSLLAVSYMAAAFAAETPKPGEPPEDPPENPFFVLPNVGQPRLSPDGTKIAFLFPHEKKMALGIFDRATKQSRMILRGEDESLRRFFWKGNDRLVFEADVSGNESFFIGSIDVEGKRVLRIAESQRLENNLTGDSARIVDELPLDPDHVGVMGYFAGNIDNAVFVGGAMTLGRLNVRNRAQSTLMELRDFDRPVREYFDNRGALRLRSRLEGHTLVWEHRASDNDRFKVVARHPFHGYMENWEPKEFAADNKTLWLISCEQHDRGALYALDTRTFEKGAPLFVPPEGEIGDIITTYDRSRLLGVRYGSERSLYHWFDATRGALQAKLEATFTGCEVIVTSTSSDEKVMLVIARHDREPGAYFVLDQRDGSLTPFKRIRNLEPTQLSHRQPVQYTARDGLVIHAYLTLPIGKSGKHLPLIMHPHGGPFGISEAWGYDRDAQFLASRGYAVLQPNYRGSGGYGREFINLGRHQWGRAMQDDLTDGVKWAIAEGIADPTRIAIYGASYGGYATLAGVELTPDLYRCGINYVGAADLELTFHWRGEEAFTNDDDFSYRREWVGPTREYRDATSAINLVDRIKVPTLHAYGLQDPRVKIDHWSRLEPQLKKYHCDYKSIIEGKQGHGFQDQDASIAFYKALEKFLAEHLAPEGNVKIGQPEVIDMPAKR